MAHDKGEVDVKKEGQGDTLEVVLTNTSFYSTIHACFQVMYSLLLFVG